MFKVLIADSMSSKAGELLAKSSGISVNDQAGISADELKAVIGEYDGLIVRSRTKVTSEILENSGQLKLIGRAGIGVDNIDLQAAAKKGIVVENAPTGNSVTTAEHSIALMFSLARNVPQGTGSMKNGKWEKKQLSGVEITDKVLGIIGLGNIGKIVADRAQGLRMKVIAFDPFADQAFAQEKGISLVGLDELLAQADFITIHAPLNEGTQNMLNGDALSKVKKGVRIINGARGGIVDEAALVEALNNGTVAGAAFDVFVKEPPDSGDPLVCHPNVICTPHLGASTAEAQVKVAIEIAEQFVAFAENGEVRNCVNQALLDEAS